MNERQPIRVAIADHQAIFRVGLATILADCEDLSLVGEAENGNEAVELCEMVEPDVIVMDIDLPLLNGIAATRVIKEHFPQIQVVLLTCADEVETTQIAHDTGARACLLKDITPNEMVEAIRLTHRDQQVVSPARLAYDLTDHLHSLQIELNNPGIESKRLREVLGTRLPTIFPEAEIQLHRFPNERLVTHPSEPRYPMDEIVWEVLERLEEPRVYAAGDEYPWGGIGEAGWLVLIPIRKANRALAGLTLAIPETRYPVEDLLGTVDLLCTILIETFDQESHRSVHPVEVRPVTELEIAGQIQARILPDRPPILKGWDLVAKLIPSRETSGDFFDFIPLPNGKLGFVIADVMDKGYGAAVFMAMCSTLFRTYAMRFPTLPAITMHSINERILSDMRGGLLATAFYGILEPDIGRLRYANAGHNPPFLFSTQKGKPIDSLRRTGMPIGVSEGATWEQKFVKFNPGDILVMYTDGITEGENSHGEFYGEHRLMEFIRSRRDHKAEEILEELLAEFHHFTGKTTEEDDIAIIILARQS